MCFFKKPKLVLVKSIPIKCTRASDPWFPEVYIDDFFEGEYIPSCIKFFLLFKKNFMKFFIQYIFSFKKKEKPRSPHNPKTPKTRFACGPLAPALIL